jgi:uncharacterized protein YhfF
VLRQLPRRASSLRTRKVKVFTDMFQAVHKQTALAEGEVDTSLSSTKKRKKFCVNFVYLW